MTSPSGIPTMSINQLPIELRCKVKVENSPVLVLNTQNIDFDLVLLKLNRLLESESESTNVETDSLKISSATVRSSLYITSLGELVSFLTNLKTYHDGQIGKDVLQSVSEYVATYDHLYYSINAADVLTHINELVVTSYHRSNKPKLDKSLSHPVEVAINWLVVLKE